jgi:hypothetical protein
MQVHREGVPEDRDALRGQGFHTRLESLDVGLGQQLVRYHLPVTHMKVLLAPIPDLAPRDLPVCGAQADRRRARVSFQSFASCQDVFVGSGQTELPDIHRQSERYVESIKVLEAVTIAFDLEHRLKLRRFPVKIRREEVHREIRRRRQ